MVVTNKYMEPKLCILDNNGNRRSSLPPSNTLVVSLLVSLSKLPQKITHNTLIFLSTGEVCFKGQKFFKDPLLEMEKKSKRKGSFVTEDETRVRYR